MFLLKIIFLNLILNFIVCQYNYAYYKGIDLIDTSRCHFSCLDCLSETNYNECILCSEDSRIFIPELMVCPCAVGK
jgi:hypothetical protein